MLQNVASRGERGPGPHWRKRLKSNASRKSDSTLYLAIARVRTRVHNQLMSAAKKLETLCLTSHRLSGTDRPAALAAVEEMAKILKTNPRIRGAETWALVVEGRRADLSFD